MGEVHHDGPQVTDPTGGVDDAVPMLVQPHERVVGEIVGLLHVAAQQVGEPRHRTELGPVQLQDAGAGGCGAGVVGDEPQGGHVLTLRWFGGVHDHHLLRRTPQDNL